MSMFALTGQQMEAFVTKLIYSTFEYFYTVYSVYYSLYSLFIPLLNIFYAFEYSFFFRLLGFMYHKLCITNSDSVSRFKH